MHIRSAPLRVIIGALALLLMAISVFCSLTLVKNASAKSECGVLILCLTPPDLLPSPTPTSGPMSGSTPTSGPIPGPTPTPGQTSRPTPRPWPTATASVSPTVASTGSLHTPVPSPTSVSPLTGWYFKNQTLGQFGSSEFSQMLVIAVIIFLFLLVSLGIGLFIFRRTLLPSINVKVPSSSTGVWSLTGMPRAFVKGISGRKKKW